MIHSSAWGCFSRSTTRPGFFFFFNDTATTEIYTLSLHDALPICNFILAQPDVGVDLGEGGGRDDAHVDAQLALQGELGDRKSTRLNSSHPSISYAVFCLKKKTATTLQFSVARDTS